MTAVAGTSFCQDVAAFASNHQILSIATAGLAVVVYSIGNLAKRVVLWICTCMGIAQKSDDVGSSSLSDRSKNAGKTLQDRDIILLLKQQGYGDPVEMGGDGRCLFRSIAPQIEQADLALIPPTYPNAARANEWDQLDLVEKSDLLRELAMETERLFIDPLSNQIDDLSVIDQGWISEFYKDMVQELEHLSFANLRERFRSTSLQDKLLYCKENFGTYYARTTRPTNWAGTAELIALSRLFQRSVEAFGNDFAASETTSHSPEGHILPYYSSLEGRLPPISIFQVGGGGHYQLLYRT